MSASDEMWDGSAAVGSGLSAEDVCSFGIGRLGSHISLGFYRLLFIDVIHLVPDSELAQTWAPRSYEAFLGD